MRVLQLPANIASQMSVTVSALRSEGVEARGLTGPSIVQDIAGLELLPAQGGHVIRRAGAAAARYAKILTSIQWADVVHWHYGPALPGAFDLKAAQMLGKKRFVEFWGSDIRNPEIERADNAWYGAAFNDPGFECRSESAANSIRTQSLFSKSGVTALIPSPGMALYVDRELFPSFHRTAQRVPVTDYQPVFPSEITARPLVVHAPTAPVCKGTRHILAALERLRSRFNFDFKLITGMPRQEAGEWIRRCDVFVDQLIAGEYGLAAVEAMALGKPVICFIKPSLLTDYPAGIPIRNANPDTVEEVLAQLLSDGSLRRRSGEEGRAWVEAHHDARKIARHLLELYQVI